MFSLVWNPMLNKYWSRSKAFFDLRNATFRDWAIIHAYQALYPKIVVYKHCKQGFFIRVQSLMINQVAICSKALLTNATSLGLLLATVIFLMINQVASISKALLTSATYIGLLARV